MAEPPGLRARLAALLRGWHRQHLWRRRQARMAADYERWVAAFDSPDAAMRAALALRAPADAAPLVWLVDTHGRSPAALAATQASWAAAWGAVPRQLLPFDGGSPGAAQATWAEAAARFPTAWLGEVPAGTRFAPHAAILFAEAARAHVAARVLYADHDHLGRGGQRVAPVFLPDWNPELLLGAPYLWPLALVHAGRVVQQGPVAASTHARWLAWTRGLAAAQVLHLPHLLGHVPAGDAAHADVPGVLQHLATLGVPCAGVDTGPWGCRPRLRPAQPPPRVSVLVPTRDRLELLAPCVRAVLETVPAVHEVWIIDNGSTQPATLDFLRQAQADPRVRVLRDDGPFNFSRLNNRAAEQATGDWLLLLNNDTLPMHADWLAALLGAGALPGVAAVGARLWYPDRTLQHAGLLLGLEGLAGDAHRRLTAGMPGHHGRAQLLQSFSALTAACLLVRRDAYLAVGGMDAEGLAVAYNDVDLCLRLRAAGHRLVWSPEAELFHFESLSRGSDQTGPRAERYQAERALMLQRWAAELQRDPAYNPNLSLQGGAFGLAWPPRVSLVQPWFEQVPATVQKA